MSTPSPQAIGLPVNKTFSIVISGNNFPAGFPGVMTFKQVPTSTDWTADYSVPLVDLAELHRPITLEGKKVQFGFVLENATPEQEAAGYLNGQYTFSFVAPGGNATEFFGDLDDPHPGEAEDHFTARGNDPEKA